MQYFSEGQEKENRFNAKKCIMDENQKLWEIAAREIVLMDGISHQLMTWRNFKFTKFFGTVAKRSCKSIFPSSLKN
jgi:hypothetical protein